MRAVVTFLVFGIVLGSGGVTAGAAELLPATAACLRENAPKVEEAIPSLNEAVEFLTGKVCAPEMDAETDRNLREMMAQLRREQCDRQKARSAESSQPGAPPAMDMCKDGSLFDMLGFSTFLQIGMQSNMKPSADATAMAAKLLLELRLKRQAGAGQR
jgi:hypothetical protein